MPTGQLRTGRMDTLKILVTKAFLHVEKYREEIYMLAHETATDLEGGPLQTFIFKVSIHVSTKEE